MKDDRRSVRPLRFGGLLLPNAEWPVVVGRAMELERLGFDLVVMDDHLSNPVRPAQPWLEVWTALAGIAAATTSIRLGPLVSNTVLRHPGLLARQASTVDQIAGGRLEIALGSGYAPSDHRGVQQPMWSAAERAVRFREAVATVDALLRGEHAPAGEFVDVGDLAIAPLSAQHPRPPLTIAADGPLALDVAATYGDAWVSFGGWDLATDEAIAITRRRSDELDRRAEAIGRDPATIGRTLLAGSAAVNRDPIWTSVEAFEDFTGRFRAIGIDTIVFYFPPDAVSRAVDDDTVGRVIHEVMPRLRAG